MIIFYNGMEAVGLFRKRCQTTERINWQEYHERSTQAGANFYVLKEICNKLLLHYVTYLALRHMYCTEARLPFDTWPM